MPQAWQDSVKTLDAVITATDGTARNVGAYSSLSVFVVVSGNTGAVTVTIQASPDDGITWFDLDTKTYTAENGNDAWSYADHFPLMRVRTTTQSNSTVSAWITGKGL